MWGRSQKAALQVDAFRVPPEGADVASEGLASGQLGARFGRIYMRRRWLAMEDATIMRGAQLKSSRATRVPLLRGSVNTKGAVSRASAIPRASELRGDV